MYKPKRRTNQAYRVVVLLADDYIGAFIIIVALVVCWIVGN